MCNLPAMAAPIALIQGASRGLGLEFCKHVLTNKPRAAVIATCRNPDRAVELRGLSEQHRGRLTLLKLDVNREEDIREAAERVKESFGGVDLLVNSSAMLHPSGKGETSLRDVSAQVHPHLTPAVISDPLVLFIVKIQKNFFNPRGKQFSLFMFYFSHLIINLEIIRFTFFPIQGLISTLTTNTVGPLVMAKYFAPLLHQGGGGFGQQPVEAAKQHSGIIINITAKVGSIGDNGRY